MLQTATRSETCADAMLPPLCCVTFGLLSAALGATALTGCRRDGVDAEPLPKSEAPRVALEFRPQPIGSNATRAPWIAHVTAVDLDRDGLLDVVACEAQDST